MLSRDFFQRRVSPKALYELTQVIRLMGGRVRLGKILRISLQVFCCLFKT